MGSTWPLPLQEKSQEGIWLRIRLYTEWHCTFGKRPASVQLIWQSWKCCCCCCCCFFFKGSLVIFQSQNGESLDVWCQFILASCRALLWVILFINPWQLPHKKCFLPLTERLGTSHLRPSTQWISTRVFLTCYLIRTDLLHPKPLKRSGKMYPNCNTNYKIIS